MFDFTDDRTREQQELEYLETYLLLPRWSADLAAHLLVGLAFDQSLNVEAGAVKWLPGVPEGWRRMRHENIFALCKHLELALEDVKGFVVGRSRTPADWIRQCELVAYSPPWLEVAQAHGLVRVGTKPSVPIAHVQSAGGLATRNRSHQYRSKRQLLAEWDEHVAANTLDIEIFQSEMIQRFCNGSPPQAADRTVTLWISQLRRERSGAAAPKWAEEMRHSHNCSLADR